MNRKIKKNIILVLVGWLLLSFLLAFLPACKTHSPCYDYKNKEVKIRHKWTRYNNIN